MTLILFGFLFVMLGTTCEACSRQMVDATNQGYDKLYRDKKDTGRLEYIPQLKMSPRLKRSEEVMCCELCEPKKIPPCYCDSLCHAYKDCCPENASKKSPSLSVVQREVSCELYAEKSMVMNKPFGFVMVKTCLKKYSASSLTNRCFESTDSTYPLQMIPVTDKNGLTFANVYCALCNDVDDASPWNLASFLNREPSTLSQNLSTMLQTFSKSYTVIPVPDYPINPRMCIRSTNMENLTDFEEDRCHEYQEPVLYAARVFRNRHCIPKSIIKECNPKMDPNECKSVCIKGIDESVTGYLFQRKPNGQSILIKFGRQLQLEYESSRCAPGELLYGSKVQCVHLGCINSGDMQCKPFEIYYTNYKLYFLWHLRTHTTGSSGPIRRCVNIILNLLSFSKIVSVIDYSRLQSYEEKECNVKSMIPIATYVGLIPVASANSLQTWLSTVQFTYTEILGGNEKTVIQRIYPGKKDLSDTPYHSVCTKGVRLRVDTKEDKESMVNALARYPLPIPIFKCSDVNITVSVEELADKKGNVNRKYKVMEVYCANNVSLLFAELLGTLIMVFLGSELKRL